VAAGGVVYRRKSSGIEIFFIKDSFNRWTFPKGHQELGETLAETAVREVREETGLTGLRYVAPLGKKVLRFRREVGLIQKAVHYFLFEAPADAKERFATREEVGEDKELIQEGKWVPMRQAFSVSSYKNSDHLLANAFRFIGGPGAAAKPTEGALPAQPAPASGNRPGRSRHRRRRWKRHGGQNRPPAAGPRVTF
jgi:diadenosine hexaphosphate hydrolase (ATP-forming)